MSNNQPMRLPTEVPPEALEEETFDPTTNPEAFAFAQQAVQAANDAPDDGVPEGAPTLPVPNYDALHIDLPVGSYNPIEGKEYATAEVRELNGEDEEYFSRGRTFHDRKARLIKRGTAKVGDDEPNDAIFDSLAQGDHEVILLGIRRATYGDELTIDLQCPNCGEDQESVVDLSEHVEIRGYDSLRHSVTLKSGKTVSFHWPTAADDRALWEYAETNKQATVAELNTQMLARVVEQIDEEPALGEATAKAMNMRDRRELVNYIAENVPGPLYRDLTHRCMNCEYEATLEVSFEDLFR